MQIGEFQALMVDLYGEQDAERGIPSTVAWLCEEVGELAQAVRKGTPDQQLHELGDVIAWVASLANQLGLSLEDAAARYRDDPPADRLTRLTSAPGTGGAQRLRKRRSRRASAIWTALRAAPLRRLSPDRNSDRPCGLGGIDPDAAHEGGIDAGGHERRGHVGQLDARAP